MSFFRLLLLGSLIIPAPLWAQRRRPPQPRYYPPITARSYELKAGDFEELGPARLVLESSEELALEKPQITKLEEIREAFDDDADRWADEIGRLHKAMLTRPPNIKRLSDEKPTTRKDSVERAKQDSTNRAKLDQYIESVTAARRELAEVMLRIRTAYDATATATVAILTVDQRAGIDPLLQAASNELTARLRRANIR